MDPVEEPYGSVGIEGPLRARGGRKVAPGPFMAPDEAPLSTPGR